MNNIEHPVKSSPYATALTGNQGAPGPLTDNQGFQARDPLTQIFNNLYAKPVKNLRVLI